MIAFAIGYTIMFFNEGLLYLDMYHLGLRVNANSYTNDSEEKESSVYTVLQIGVGYC